MNPYFSERALEKKEKKERKERKRKEGGRGAIRGKGKKKGFIKPSSRRYG